MTALKNIFGNAELEVFSLYFVAEGRFNSEGARDIL